MFLNKHKKFSQEENEKKMESEQNKVDKQKRKLNEMIKYKA